MARRGAREKFVARQALCDSWDYARGGDAPYRRFSLRVAQQAQDFVNEWRTDHRSAARLGRRIAEHHAPRRHREREEEKKKIFAVAFVAGAKDSAGAARRVGAEAPPERFTQRPVERELHLVGQQRVVGMVAREDAVVEPDHEDQIEIEPARLEHRQRNHRARRFAVGRARGTIERGLDHRGELGRVNDAWAPGERRPSSESVERGAHGAPRAHGIIGVVIGISQPCARD